MVKNKDSVIGLLDSVVSVIGIALIWYGTFLIYSPASFIILGCILFLPTIFERSERG